VETIWHITLDGTPAVPGDEGFVHASFTSQLAGTLAVHYAGARSIVLLRLDPTSLGERLVVEPSRDDALFPHICGELVDSDILETRALESGPEGRFPLADLP
jgi:uncharacterized protein (DUF952 family)